MQVLHVYKTYYPTSTGGCEQAIKSLTSHTQKLGYQNKLLTLSSKPGMVRTHSLEVISLPITFEIASCPINLKLLTQFKNYVKDADILHFHFPWPFADLLYLLLATKKPTIVTYQSDIVRQRLLKYIYSPVMKAFLARVDKIVLSSDNYLHSSKAIQPYLRKCTVVPLGLDDEDYPTPAPKLLADWEQKVGKNFMLFIGVLRNYKGLEYLLEAISGTSIPLVLIGTGNGEQKLRKRSGNLPNVTCVGRVSEEDKIALIKLCRAVILPSHLRSEAFGVCLLEGLMQGKPLISTDLQTGTSFVNQDNVTGFVVPPSNAQALKAAIIKLHDHPTLATEMGANGREHFVKHFRAQEMANRYDELYKAITNN